MIGSVVLWLIMTSGSGYIEPMTLDPARMRCGLPGVVVGVQVDRLEDPTVARWVDPQDPNAHCDVDVAARVAAMPMGEFHFATTHVRAAGDAVPYLSPDPHTSRLWMRSGRVPDPPATTPEQVALAALRAQVLELSVRLSAAEARVAALTAQQAQVRAALEAALKLIPQ